MTNVKNVKTKCYVCDTDFGGPVLLSYNSKMGKPDIKPLTCPKCGAPYKREMEMNVGWAKGLLEIFIDDPQGAKDELTEYARSENWIDQAGNVLKNLSFDQWEKDDEINNDLFKDNEEYMASRPQFVEKRNRLKEMSQRGELVTKIESLINDAKNQFSEEKAKYQANIK